MTLQLTLFGNVLKPPAPSAAEFDAIGRLVDAIEPCDPNLEDEERPRLAAKCADVLERLQQGPATGIELGKICNRYGARLHDLKRAGYHWDKVKIAVGVWQYWLIEKLMEEQNEATEASE